MSKKPLQVAGIVNELAGASGFFTPSGSPPPRDSNNPLLATTEQAAESQPGANSSPAISSRRSPRSPRKVASQTPDERSDERTDEASNGPQTPRPDLRTIERTADRYPSRLPAREKVRHSFDVFADQLISLRELALEQEKLFGERVLIGDLVQQAIDMLITKERNR